MGTAQIISLILSIITSLITIGVFFSKPFRSFFTNQKKEKAEKEAREQDQAETDRCLIRDRLSSIYFKHYRECELKEYEFKNAEQLYKQYKKLGGNSFVDKMWKEIQEWQIVA